MRENTVALLAALVMILLCVGLVTLILSSSHSSDRVLTERFLEQEADFNHLANMAIEDSRVRIIGSSFVGLKGGDSLFTTYLDEDKPWPRSESEFGFTHERWDEYRRLFKKVGVGLSREDKIPGAIFFRASMDFALFYEADNVITEKGYVYSPKPIYHSLTDSLDHLEIDCPATVFKKLSDNWYLYYECSISKPE
jgi:hypothetical protein